MTTLPALYTARSDVDPIHLSRVEDWYVRRHAPDLLRAGFYTAQVYYSEVGAPRICNLYEIPGPELFLSQGYRDVAAKDTEGPDVIALLTSRSNTAYDQVLTVDVPDDGLDWAAGGRGGGVTAPALSTVRLDLPEGDEDALLAWYRSQEFPRLRRQPGFRAGRVCRRGPPHPVAASTDPRWLVIHEWESVSAAMADGTTEQVRARHVAAFPGRLGHLAYNVGRRRFQFPRTGA